MLVNLTLPVFNEEEQLWENTLRICRLVQSLPERYEVVIADNASTDRTPAIAKALCREIPFLSLRHFRRKGRGYALRQVWSESNAAILSYMDIDLSTDLSCYHTLISSLTAGRACISVGSRLHRASVTKRGIKREVISRVYNALLQVALGAAFGDAQCGFKAITKPASMLLLPIVEDNSWFFDTELLILANRFEIPIHEIPVKWTDDPTSTVRILRTALDNLKAIRRLQRCKALHSNLALSRGKADGTQILAERPDTFCAALHIGKGVENV